MPDHGRSSLYRKAFLFFIFCLIGCIHVEAQVAILDTCGPAWGVQMNCRNCNGTTVANSTLKSHKRHFQPLDANTLQSSVNCKSCNIAQAPWKYMGLGSFTVEIYVKILGPSVIRGGLPAGAISAFAPLVGNKAYTLLPFPSLQPNPAELNNTGWIIFLTPDTRYAWVNVADGHLYSETPNNATAFEARVAAQGNLPAIRLNDGLWHLVSVVVNRATNLIWIYTDGRRQFSYPLIAGLTSIDAPNSSLVTSYSMALGNDATSNFYFGLNGSLTQYRLWKVARTDAQILAYAQQYINAGSAEATGLVYYNEFMPCIVDATLGVICKGRRILDSVELATGTPTVNTLMWLDWSGLPTSFTSRDVWVNAWREFADLPEGLRRTCTLTATASLTRSVTVSQTGTKTPIPTKTAPPPVPSDIPLYLPSAPFWNPSPQFPAVSPNLLPPSFTPAFLPPNFLPPAFVSPEFRPPSALQPQFLQPQFLPPSVLPPQFLPPSAVPPEFRPPELLPPQFVAPQFLPPNLLPPQLLPPAFLPPELVPPSFRTPDLLPPQFVSPQFLPPALLPPQFLQPEQLQPQFLQPTFVPPAFRPPSTLPPEFIAPQFLPPSLLPPAVLPPQFRPPSDLSPEFLQPQFLPPAVLPPQFVSPEFRPPSQLEPQFLTPDNLQPQFLQPQFLPPNDVSPEFRPPSQLQPEFLQPQFLPPDLVSPEFRPPSQLQPEFLQPQFLPPDLVPPEFRTPSQLSPEFLQPQFLTPDHLQPQFLPSANAADDGNDNLLLLLLLLLLLIPLLLLPLLLLFLWKGCGFFGGAAKALPMDPIAPLVSSVLPDHPLVYPNDPFYFMGPPPAPPPWLSPMAFRHVDMSPPAPLVIEREGAPIYMLGNAANDDEVGLEMARGLKRSLALARDALREADMDFGDVSSDAVRIAVNGVPSNAQIGLQGDPSNIRVFMDGVQQQTPGMRSPSFRTNEAPYW